MIKDIRSVTDEKSADNPNGTYAITPSFNITYSDYLETFGVHVKGTGKRRDMTLFRGVMRNVSRADARKYVHRIIAQYKPILKQYPDLLQFNGKQYLK